MTLPIPNLDDKRFDQLVEEMAELIPVFDPSWTDYNASDPGMTLIELFAWLGEMLVYRSSRIAPAQLEQFLNLISLPNKPPDPDTPLTEQVRATMLALHHEVRAVTAQDYENRVKQASLQVARVRCITHRNIARNTEVGRRLFSRGRVSCLILTRNAFSSVILDPDGECRDVTDAAALADGPPVKLPTEEGDMLVVGSLASFGSVEFVLSQTGRNYDLTFQYNGAAGWTDLGAADKLVDYTFGWSQSGAVLFEPPDDWVPGGEGGAEYLVRIVLASLPGIPAVAQCIVPRQLQPSTQLVDHLLADLEPRRLLGTINVVAGPVWAPVQPKVLICAEPDLSAHVVRGRVCAAIRNWFDAWSGGAEDTGWPIGRSVYVSDLDEILSNVPGVCQNLGLQLFSSADRQQPRVVEAPVIYHDDGAQIGLWLAEYQLPLAWFDPDQVVVGYTYATAIVRIILTKEDSGDDDHEDVGWTPHRRGVVADAVRALFDPNTPQGPASDWLNSAWDVTSQDIVDVLASHHLPPGEYVLHMSGQASRRFQTSLQTGGHGAIEGADSFHFQQAELAAATISLLTIGREALQ